MHRNLLGLMLCLLLTTAYAHDSPAHITAANTPAIEAITTLADASHSSGETPSPSDADSGTSDRKSTRLNSSHVAISYAVFCLKKKMKKRWQTGSSHATFQQTVWTKRR